jgi:uncharacterized protein YqgC (DUF456 family)
MMDGMNMMGLMGSGCCGMFTILPGLLSMVGPLLAVGATVYLLAKRSETAVQNER